MAEKGKPMVQAPAQFDSCTYLTVLISNICSNTVEEKAFLVQWRINKTHPTFVPHFGP